MGKGAVRWQKAGGSPIGIAKVHILKFYLALLEAQGPCSRNVLHLGEWDPGTLPL